ncbi:CPBP family intramembrane glutamic endopeptidase [Facklamia sp. 7083-14-GEN3]|uniref:CPBP family intramembrane glutamic endopeptidase n=1 Tax=Facklamia sp. 7083-14-GEN3 TaxID=2973478 RepID=UPI00215B9EBF|nr:type II CAAX endopeptidase family protein [Facklamia sp. 7083-14-GEN3]MCR8968823.1 CPBP family intramembrane metalloprotease [Facklamia sp. 7083-14-GEN3]
MKNKGLILVVTYLFFYFVLPLIASASGLSLEGIPWVTLTSMAIICLVAWYLYGNFLKNQWQHLLAQTGWKRFLGNIVVYIFVVNIVRVILLNIFEPFIDIDSLGANQQAIQDLVENVPSYFTFFMLVIFAPLVEELIFREIIIGPSVHKNKSFKWFMTIISIVLFTGAHMKVPSDAILYLPLTLGITYFYWKYQANVVASMSFHFINNLISWIVLTFFAQL